ncbi:ATP-binding protein [Nocardioides sp. GXZ039]|uniref:ATP-binding protein n=1 Tax=Nocardioides sp. GXZ039 TaxID=3136018 RepID=UPI0030F3E7C6
MTIKTLLVANRGEIALRVMRTASRLGIRTVAIHTDLDARAPHVRAADVAVEVPSYLDVDAVVAAARESGADAVHPGYGFLSERAVFAQALEDAGITLVGPSAVVMEQMGRKDAAREIAVAAGVPVVPTGDQADYPVLVKAAAGGGGKGMRIVRSAAELAEATAAAQREAASAFGDDTVLIEKYVEHGRHIEVQVIGDAHGAVRHLFERDCSTQRRHQKVLEEAPAPTIDDATRARITQAAVDLAAHVGYQNAGTVEFLLDAATGEFYFLEMNTRLQVEHPVTELAVTVEGEHPDLVELQLRVAAGEPLGFAQDDVALAAHAIEARVYAEDSFGGFLPQAGTASLVIWPHTPGTRVDEALSTGQVVSTAYDPMLGKVIASGPDREAARRALIDALDQTVVLGLTTNTGFLRTLLASEEFRDATIDTAWLDRVEVPAPDPAEARRQAAWALFDAVRPEVSEAGAFLSDGFRIGADPAPIRVELDELVELGDRPLVAPVALVSPGRVELAWEGQRYVFRRPDPAAREPDVGDGTVLAPMPGTVLDVRVAAGDAVDEGQVLGIMEAMKMELSLTAPFAGTLAAVDVAAGDQVALGAPLFVVEAGEPGESDESAEAGDE